jgi:hypothetical protein
VKIEPFPTDKYYWQNIAALQDLITSFLFLEKTWYGAVDTSTIYALHPATGIFATESQRSLSVLYLVF